MRLHADSSPSGSSGSGLVQPAAKIRLLHARLATYALRSGHQWSPTAAHRSQHPALGGYVRRRCICRRCSGHPGRQSSCTASLCHTHDERRPPTTSQDDLSVRLPGGWHGLSFPSWLPCRAPFLLLHETPFPPEFRIHCTLLSPSTMPPNNQSSAIIKQAILTQE